MDTEESVMHFHLDGDTYWYDSTNKVRGRIMVKQWGSKPYDLYLVSGDASGEVFHTIIDVYDTIVEGVETSFLTAVPTQFPPELRRRLHCFCYSPPMKLDNGRVVVDRIRNDRPCGSNTGACAGSVCGDFCKRSYDEEQEQLTQSSNALNLSGD